MVNTIKDIFVKQAAIIYKRAPHISAVFPVLTGLEGFGCQAQLFPPFWTGRSWAPDEHFPPYQPWNFQAPSQTGCTVSNNSTGKHNSTQALFIKPSSYRSWAAAGQQNPWFFIGLGHLCHRMLPPRTQWTTSTALHVFQVYCMPNVKSWPDLQKVKVIRINTK